MSALLFYRAVAGSLEAAGRFAVGSRQDRRGLPLGRGAVAKHPKRTEPLGMAEKTVGNSGLCSAVPITCFRSKKENKIEKENEIEIETETENDSGKGGGALCPGVCGCVMPRRFFYFRNCRGGQCPSV